MRFQVLGIYVLPTTFTHMQSQYAHGFNNLTVFFYILFYFIFNNIIVLFYSHL